MAKFEPEHVEQPPVLIRRDGQIICLVDYEDKGNGKIVPRKGYDITAGYEHRRGKDAVEGIPLLNEYVRPREAGEMAYQAAASSNGWGNSWSELPEEQKSSWRQIASAVLKYEAGDEVPYMY